MSEAGAPTPLPYTEASLSRWLRATLEPHFELTPEAWLRDPLTGVDLRVDFLARSHDERFPFDPFGIEVKSCAREINPLIQAFKQSLDYKRCTVNDQRLGALRGLALEAVFLFRGQQRLEIEASDQLDWIRYGVVRLAGKHNVGEIVLHHRERLRMEISDAPLWGLRRGATETGARWPCRRRTGNSRRRVA